MTSTEARERLIHNALRAAVIVLEGGRVTAEDFPAATADEYRQLIVEEGRS